MSFDARANTKRSSWTMHGASFPSSIWTCSPVRPRLSAQIPTLPYSYLPTFDFSNVMKVDYDFIPEATHFLQLEQPEECAAAVREFVDRQALA